MGKILRLGQQWADDAAPSNKFWIGADPMNARVHHGDGLVILGRECASVAELESVAAEIRYELEEVLTEARRKFARRS